MVASKKRGKQTVVLDSGPSIVTVASITGPMEGQGLLGPYYDQVLEDNLCGHKSWEQCESYMQQQVVQMVLAKGIMSMDQVDCILGGDLLNQLMAVHFAMRDTERPFLGIYGACSTFAASAAVGAMFIDGGFFKNVVTCVSSHHDAAERQYRFPTELGVQRPPIAQWTVTGAGGMLLSSEVSGKPKIKAVTLGKIVDMGLKDPNAMGPAMAPAAEDTIFTHLQDLGRDITYYDQIYTGDLGAIGKELVIQLLGEKGISARPYYEDCGCMIYEEKQDAHAGASGCASSAIAFCASIYPAMLQKKLRRVLLVGTGSLHSTTSYQQKESIPCIAHAISIEMD